MKNNKLYIFTFAAAILIAFTTCKKYPEGGLVGQTRLHLFGGHKVGCSKTWKLKLYEVNGIDSTMLIKTVAGLDNFITYKYKTSDPGIKHIANTSIQNYIGFVDNKKILIAYDWVTNDDSLQRKIINNQYIYQRNIFFPEFLKVNPEWDIIKLTKRQLIMTIQLKNSYKIILTH